MLVFVLLLFADKTNLNEDNAEDLGGRTTAETQGSSTKEQPVGSTGDLLSMIPPATPSEDLAKLLTALEQEENPESRGSLLQQIVGEYREMGRADIAAVYASTLAREAPNVKNFVVAGALFRYATSMESVLHDSTVFRRFSDEALAHLESAVELEPKNEGALIELGLAMIESRKPGMGMQGIMKLREVTEINPKNVEALFQLGKFSMDTGQWDKAEQRFRQVLEIVPGDLNTKYFLGLTLRQLGKSAEYQNIMSEIAAQDQDTVLARMATQALNGI